MRKYSKFVRGFLFLTLAGLFCFRLDAQNFRFNHLGPEDGLSQLTVNCIYQDSHGFLWFGTQEGLNRFDGYNFIDYKSEPENPNSLSHSWIWDVMEDSRKNLWVATWSGLNRISPDGCRIKRYYPEADRPGSISGERAVSLAESPDGKLWIGTWGGGLNLYDPVSDSFTCFSNSEDPGKSYPGDYIRKIFLDSENNLWIGTWSGIWRADISMPGKPLFQKISPPADIPGEEIKITSIIVDREGYTWAGSLGSGIFRIAPGSDSMENITPLLAGKNTSVPRQVTSLTIDRNRKIWAGTVSRGIFIIDPGNYTARSIRYYENNESGLSADNVSSLFCDRGGLVWAGTSGLDFYNPALNRFSADYDLHSLTTDPGKIKNISAICQDEEDRIWLGTPGNGLFCLESSGNINNSDWITGILPGLNSLNISSVVNGTQGEIWIGTRGNGIIQLFPSPPYFRNLVEKAASTETHGMNYVNGLYFVPPDGLWIATYDNGLIRYDTRRNTVKKFMHDPSDPASFPANYLLRIYGGKENRLWICTWGAGIIDFDPVSLSWKSYTNIPDDPNSLADNIPHTVWTGNNRVWTGTRKGLSLMEKSDSGVIQFINYNTSDGLPGNIVNTIIGDRNGRLWITTNSGMSCFSPDSGIFRNYDISDGLQSNEFNAGSGLLLRDGRIIFGGVGGFNIFYPDSIASTYFNPPVVLTSVKVFDNEIAFDPGEMSLRLDYHQNFLSFEYSSLDYSKPEKNLYKYWMVGVDRDWVFAGKRRYISYTELEPGNYTLMVQGTNSDGIWSDNVLELKIDISPPYWQTWWFRIAIALVFLFGIYSVISSRFRKLKEMEHLRVRIASDLHDDIGSSLTHISIHSQMMKEKMKDKKNSGSLEKIDELSREVISTMSDIVWSIDARNDSLRDMLDRMRDYAHSLLSEKEISVQFRQKEMDKNRRMDVLFRQNIFSVFKEIINNIIKHSGADRVEIDLDNGGKGFIMRISDNGKGFDTEHEIRGNGLRNMKMRAARLGGKLRIESGSGTIIELRTRQL